MPIASVQMQALVYYRSVLRYLAVKAANRFWPHWFFHWLAPVALKQVYLAPREGWVILRNRLCGLCGSDLSLLRGSESFLLEPYGSFPAILGHEVVSQIEWAPPDSPWHTGDRVAIDRSWAARSGICRPAASAPRESIICVNALPRAPWPRE